MKFTETKLKGCVVIEPDVFRDSRGYFMESYHLNKFENALLSTTHFVQDNESKSEYGVIRGLHCQRGEHAQAKLVRVISGKILDVAVDVRTESPTFGQYISVELSGENKKQLFVPKGFLHGFSVLSEEAIVFYKCDAFYNRNSEDGVNPLDSVLNIDWKILPEDRKFSDKDRNAGSFLTFKPLLI